MLSSSAQSRRSGFSLPEVLLAMLVFAVAVGTILALLTRNIEMVNRLSMENEAMRLGATLEQRFQMEKFEDVFANVTSGKKYYCFHYDADPEARRSRPAPPAVPELSPMPLTPLPPNPILGENYIVVPSARNEDDVLLDSDVTALNGTLFQVQLERLTSASNPESGFPPPSATVANSAVIVIQASFYRVGAVGTTVDITEEDPAYEYILAVRR